MRSIFLTLCAVTSIFVLPTAKAQAGHFTELATVTCEYADAAELFHRSLCRCRRATDYSERLADRLAHAAGDLRQAVRVGADPRRIAVIYDEVFVLHDRLSELLGSGCSRPDPVVLAYWRPLDQAFENLVCAIEGCQPVCPLITHHRHVNRGPQFGHGHQVGRPAIVVAQPGFGGGFPGVLPGGIDHRNLDPRFGNNFSGGFGSGFDNRDWNRGRDRDLRDRDLRGSNHPEFHRQRDSDFRRDLDRNQLSRDSRDSFRRDRQDDLRRDFPRATEPRDLHSAAVRSILSRLFD